MFRPRIAISSGRLFASGVVIRAPERTPSAFVAFRLLPGVPGCAAYPSGCERACGPFPLLLMRLALAYRLERGFVLRWE